jgi:hypothetical protein
MVRWRFWWFRLFLPYLPPTLPRTFGLCILYRASRCDGGVFDAAHDGDDVAGGYTDDIAAARWQRRFAQA